MLRRCPHATGRGRRARGCEHGSAGYCPRPGAGLRPGGLRAGHAVAPGRACCGCRACRDLSPAREGAPSDRSAAIGSHRARPVAAARVRPGGAGSTVNGYVFHIGLALVFFGYAPHIAFIRRVTRRRLAGAARRRDVRRVGSHHRLAAAGLGMRLTDPVLQDDLERRRLDHLDDGLPAHLHRHGGVAGRPTRSWRATTCSTAARWRCTC